jgi:hypothetical protein
MSPPELGSAFADVYHKYSPSITGYIGKHDGLKLVVRNGLAPIVSVSYVALHTSTAQKVGIALLGFIVLLGFIRLLKRRGQKA